MAAPTLDRVDAPTGAQTVTLAEASEERREDIVLRRLRAGRRRMPIGASNLLWTRAHVDDVARAVLAALDTQAADGQVLNWVSSTR